MNTARGLGNAIDLACAGKLEVPSEGLTNPV